MSNIEIGYKEMFALTKYDMRNGVDWNMISVKAVV